MATELITQEQFAASVREVAESLSRELTVSGFEVYVAMKSRSGRSRYTLWMEYDPVADSWTGIDPYHGTTLPWLARQIDEAMRRCAR